MELVQVLEGINDLGCGCDQPSQVNGLGDLTEAQAMFGTFALFAGLALVISEVQSRRATRSPVAYALKRARRQRAFGVHGLGGDARITEREFKNGGIEHHGEHVSITHEHGAYVVKRHPAHRKGHAVESARTLTAARKLAGKLKR